MRALSKVLKVVLGIAVGLVLAELLFAWRDQGAFPHVNFYLSDPVLGTRLSPHASQRLAFSGNPVTAVHTNSLGFRGAEWPARDPRDVLVVGDSQVFGLGVEDDQTFSAQLERQLGPGGHVLNAGVPTYGPLEYSALVERWVLERKPAKVVYVLNLANDLFELERPNRERHAVWDGWAVRKETAPDHVRDFPLRGWLMSRSHLVFALRGWLRGLSADDAQFASEGTWRELVAAGRRAPARPAPSAHDVSTALERRVELEAELHELDESIIISFGQHAVRDRRFLEAMRSLGQTRGDPRDIVSRSFSEEARPVFSIAFQLLYAALALDKNDKLLRELAQAAGDRPFLELVNTRAKQREALAQLSDQVSDPRAAGPLDAILERTARACKGVGAELLVAILPLDVQVSSAEWKKYGRPEIDLGATHALIDDVAERAARLGIRSVDLTATLRAAEPGAFLLGDLHMSATGHAAVARALPAAFDAPLPERSALPAGRSLFPARDEWSASEPIGAEGPAAASCEVRRVREWLSVRCKADPRDPAVSLGLLRGGHGDALAEVAHDPGSDSGMDLALIVPVLPGETALASLGWAQHGHALRIERPDGVVLRVTFGPQMPATAARGVQPAAIAGELLGPARGALYDRRCTERLRDGSARLAAVAHMKEHELWQTCILGNRQLCPAGEVSFGVLGRCVPECSMAQPCAQDSVCSAWRSKFGCVAP
ncbi:MAG TPA: hypothetical protein VJV78_01205 [Polyangiales bacterium]|nr:hypothetical protein [Polyangiales bacterium]